MMVDWSALTPREILRSLAAAPRVAGPWEYEKRRSGHERLRRRLWHPENGFEAGHFLIQRIPSQLGPKWFTGWTGRYVTVEGDAEDAKRFADELLREAGYVLDTEPT